MKVLITRKDNGVEERECDYFEVFNGALTLSIRGKEKDSFGFTEDTVIYACTDWLECVVVEDSQK